MTKRQSAPGQCFFCKQTFSKRGILRHLRSCPERAQAIRAERGHRRHLFHIKVEDTFFPAYWLHIEIGATDTLVDLDEFLRAIWMECCGHLSHFIKDNVYYERVRIDEGFGMWQERSMGVSLRDVLNVGDVFTYEYDFGTTSFLKLEVVGERDGVLPRGEVRVLARNYKPVFPCAVCDKPATRMDTYQYPPVPYCDVHTPEYGDEALAPLVNSPRSGMCGYTGPFEDAYRFEVSPPEHP